MAQASLTADAGACVRNLQVPVHCMGADRGAQPAVRGTRRGCAVPRRAPICHRSGTPRAERARCVPRCRRLAAARSPPSLPPRTSPPRPPGAAGGGVLARRAAADPEPSGGRQSRGPHSCPRAALPHDQDLAHSTGGQGRRARHARRRPPPPRLVCLRSCPRALCGAPRRPPRAVPHRPWLLTHRPRSKRQPLLAARSPMRPKPQTLPRMGLLWPPWAQAAFQLAYAGHAPRHRAVHSAATRAIGTPAGGPWSTDRLRRGHRAARKRRWLAMASARQAAQMSKIACRQAHGIHWMDR